MEHQLSAAAVSRETLINKMKPYRPGPSIQFNLFLKLRYIHAAIYFHTYRC